MMQPLWLRKISRERSLLILSAFLFLLIACLVLWFTLSKLKEVRQDIAHNHQLVIWMKVKAPVIHHIRKSKHSDNVRREVFSIVEEQFNEFHDTLTVIGKSEGLIVLNFSEISFDELIAKLFSLYKDYQIDIVQLQVNKVKDTGNVQARIELRYQSL